MGQILGDILPQHRHVLLNTTQLRKWLESSDAKTQYEATKESKVLAGKWLEKAGAKPFIFLKNPDGFCKPDCEELQCLPAAGTLRALNGSTSEERFEWWVTLNGSTSEERFEWWVTLFAGFIGFVMQADPGVELVHIWNEPNVVSLFLVLLLKQWSLYI